MSFRDFVRRLIDGPTHTTAAPSTPLTTDQGIAMWIRGTEGSEADITIGDNFEKLVKLGYMANPFVYRGIDLIASSAARIVPLVYRVKGQGESVEVLEVEDPRDPLKALLSEPNEDQDWGEFVYELVAYNLLAGVSYVQGARPTPQTPARFLYSLRPDWTTPEKGNRATPITRYAYKPNGSDADKQWYEPANLLKPGSGEVTRIRRFNPMDYYSGFGPGKAIGMSIETNNHGRRWNRNLLRNGAFPPGILTTDQRLQTGEIDRMEDTWERKYGGSLRAGKVPILGMLKWQQTGLPPADMQFIEGQKQTALEVAIGLGVPPEFLGDTEHRTYASMSEARYFLYTGCVIPMLTRILGKLNGWLSPQFGEDVFIGYDEDKIEALQYVRSERWKQVQDADFLTVDEKREETGYSARPDGEGDVILVDGNKVGLATLQGTDGGPA